MASSTLFGFHGRYLKIDLNSGRSEAVTIPERQLRDYLGGVGLATSILLKEGDSSHPPLSPESSIVFCFSSLVGSPITTSAKFAVVSRSPLTGLINDAMAGSGFALAGKRTGYDAILIRGKTARPTVLLIENDSVQLVDATEWWGQPARETENSIKHRWGNHFEVSSIGLAGENQVRFATLSHHGRHAGRGGTGAVFGSKQLKAVAVAGNRRCTWAFPERLVEKSRELSRLSLGDATKKYRELGTVENLVTLNRLGGLPTRNFQSGSFADAEAYAGASLQTVATRTRSSCAACTIGCEHFYQLKPTGDAAKTKTARLEYENLYALGPLCGIADPAVAIEASAKCDEYGLDTISTGASIAFAMECYEQGLIDQPMEFGDAAHLLKAIDLIGRAEDFGQFLGLGTKRMSEIIGQGSSAFAPHVKGLEFPGYEPRAMKTMALGFAVQTRGADHNRSGAYESDFAEGSARLKIDDQSAAAAVDSENRSAIFDSMILCKFVRRVFEDFYTEAAELVSLITGWEVTPSELQTTAQRIVSAKKLYNIQAGWSPQQDDLPDRFFDSQAGTFNQPIDRTDFRRAIQQYNRLRGWTDGGYLSDEHLRQLGLLEIIGETTVLPD